MTPTVSRQPSPVGFRPRKPALPAAIVVCLVLIMAAVGSVWRDLGDSNPALVYYNTVRTDLPIVVTERGNLESQLQTSIICEVEAVSFDRGSGTNGTQIIYIVPNGSTVHEGDLLVELDSAAMNEQVDVHTLHVHEAQSQKIQADARYENQLTQNETAKSQAELNVELAKLKLKMYVDPDSGTFKLALENIERLIDDTRNNILEAQAAMELQKTEKAGMEALFKLGYKARSELNQSRFKFLQAEAGLAAEVNKLSNHEASRQQLHTYEQEMQRLTLVGDVATAKRDLKRAITNNKSQLAQAEAQRVQFQKKEKGEIALMEKYKRLSKLCKIYAPHDGMVVYAKDSGSEIAEGVTVRQRQTLITLPDLSRMQVKTQIHEAVLDQVHTGQPVTVKIDAFPNRMYDGVVDEVAVIPTSSSYSNIKTYACVIRIIKEVDQLKPGMTSVVEIHVDRATDIVSVPVQAIVQVGKKTWCYVDEGNRVTQQDVELGRSNDKFVELVSGVEAGQLVVLNPMAIFSKQQKEENEISPDKNTSDAPTIPPEELARQEARQKARTAVAENRPSKQRSRRQKPDNGGQPGRSPGRVVGGGGGE